MTNVSLSVRGKNYAGWKSVRVTRSIESIAGSFSLSLTERWSGHDELWPISEGDDCVVRIGSHPVITGYIDVLRRTVGATEHTVTVDGRDKTGDLVDCAAYVAGPTKKPQWQFSKTPVLGLVQKLCERYGIKVRLADGIVPPILPKKLTIDPGDTAFDAIDHVCAQAGLLPISDGQGGLLLTRANPFVRCVTALVEGVNVLPGASSEFNHSARFHRYMVLGQHSGSDDFFGESAAAIKGEATDPNVKRTARLLIVRPEHNTTSATAKLRAEWEASVRAARADTVSIPVAGWTQSDGALWPINAIVSVNCPLLGVKGDMLITQTTFNLSRSEGSTTELTLKHPKAFLPQSQVPAANGLWKEIAKGV